MKLTAKQVPVITYRIPTGKTIIFNEQQVQAVLAIKAWLLSLDTCYTLSGYAGTGKSSIVGYIIQNMKGVSVSAPTHKAKMVIEKFTGKPGATIQALLGLKPDMSLEDFDIDNIKFDVSGRSMISTYRLVVVDEASMLNEDLFNLLVQKAKESGTKLLFLADKAQLPPVNEHLSKIFEVENQTLLTKVERQSGDNPLMSVYDSIRNNIHSESDTYQHANQTLDSDKGRQGIVFVDENIFSNAVVEVFSSEFYERDANFCKILAYRNHNVGKWNKLVRDTIIKIPYPRIVEPGDVLMSYNTVSKNKEPLVYNSADYKVLDVQERTDSRDIQVYTTLLQDVDTRQKTTVNILVPEPENIQKFLDVVEKLRNAAKKAMGTERAALWARYYGAKSEYILMQQVKDIPKDMDYGYACTVHKSQGSTYNTVFIDEDDIDRNRNNTERNKLKYVALSRPTNIAYCLYTGR